MAAALVNVNSSLLLQLEIMMAQLSQLAAATPCDHGNDGHYCERNDPGTDFTGV